MDLGLRGRVAVVTAQVAEGVRVITGARHSSAELDELVEAGSVRVVPVDLANPAGPSTLVASAGDRIDILVNNEGSAPPRVGGFRSVTDEQ